MSEVYAARLTAKKHINEQCAECNVKKNSNGLYNHDDIVKAKETIEGKLKEVFLDHVSGLTMANLLDTKDNAINSVTTTQMVTADALITQAKKDAMVADATAKKIAKSLGTEAAAATIIMTREEAKREAERQNIANQTIMGTKDGLVEVLKRLIGGAILDPVTKIADGSRDKSLQKHRCLQTSRSVPTGIRQRCTPRGRRRIGLNHRDVPIRFRFSVANQAQFRPP